MTDKFISIIKQFCPLKEEDAGEFASMKVNGMKFRVQHFTAEGLGKVSLMNASGMCGLMKMQTIIVNPFEVDAPMLSYDRVEAMGNDLLLMEPFNTTLSGAFDTSALSEVAEQYRNLPDRNPGKQWYDDLRMNGLLLQKKGKKKAYGKSFDELAEAFATVYMKNAIKAEKCDVAQKKAKAAVYSEGLLTNGGPSTDVFRKELGPEKTQQFFREVLFGC